MKVLSLSSRVSRSPKGKWWTQRLSRWRNRVGQVMDAFLYRFGRRQDEEVLDYSLRFDKEASKAQKMAGEIAPPPPPQWKSHLIMKKMRLHEDKGALGDTQLTP